MYETKLQLLKTGEGQYNCSVCGDFEVEIRKHTDSLWQAIQTDFADHVRRRHPDQETPQNS